MQCARPAAAKNAFFTSLPSLKAAVAAVASPTPITREAAATLVAMIYKVMNAAAAAGDGSTK